MQAMQECPDGPKGPKFTKLYDKGWDRLGGLVTLKGGASVTAVWVFLAKHCGHENSLSCSVDLIAGELNISARTVIRATKYLEENGAIVILKVGTANVYVLNDQEVWKTYEEHKRFCGFRTKTLVGIKENANIRKRLTHMIGEPLLPGFDQVTGEIAEAAE